MADPEKPEGEEANNKSGIMKYLILGFSLLNLTVICGGAFLVYKYTIGYKPPILTEDHLYEKMNVEKQFKEGEPIIYSLDPFTVNLLTPRHVINLEVSVELLDEDGFEEVISEDPRARDAIVRILNKKSKSDLESIQGKLFLKDQITVAINDFLDDGVVKDVYFSRFVVQRR